MSRLVAIRASSLPELFDCPARWEAKHIRGLRTPSSAASQIGTAIHAGAAAFDASRIVDGGITVDEAAGAVVDAIYKPEQDVQWDDESPAAAEKICLALHHRYCTIISPQRDYVAVEIDCDSLDITDLGIRLTGKVDRVRAIGDGYGISDLKSGKTAVAANGTVDTSAHAFQMGAYELLAECSSGLPITEPAEIVGMQTGKTDKAQRVGTGLISGAREMLLGDGDSPGVLEHAANLVRSGVFYGNPRSMLCNKKFCPVFERCKYRL